MKDLNKDATVTIRLRASELELIDAAAKIDGMRRSEWLRALAVKTAKKRTAK